MLALPLICSRTETEVRVSGINTASGHISVTQSILVAVAVALPAPSIFQQMPS